MLIWGLFALVIIIADQAAKYIVVQNIGLDQTITIINKLFEFVYVKNTGAAFSIFSDGTWILSVISISFCIGAVTYFVKRKPESRLLCFAISLMFAGAAGNAIDRISRGYVVDFIKTVFINFPVFNIADISITTGVALLTIYVIFFDKEDLNGKDNSDDTREE